MILSFSTHINEKPSYFVEKIHSGLLQNDLMYGFDISYDHHFNINVLSNCEPKLHTIREDKNNRWKAGVMIDFFINVRTKSMFRFAPRLPVVSIQKILIKYWDKSPKIYIDGRNFPVDDTNVWQLAQNDGFDNIVDFFAYFDKDFTGKIIHWTDLRY